VHQAVRIVPEAPPMPAHFRSSPAASTWQTRGNTCTIERRPGLRPAGRERAFPAAISSGPVTLPLAPSSLRVRMAGGAGSRKVRGAHAAAAASSRFSGSSGWDGASLIRGTHGAGRPAMRSGSGHAPAGPGTRHPSLGPMRRSRDRGRERHIDARTATARGHRRSSRRRTR